MQRSSKIRDIATQYDSQQQFVFKYALAAKTTANDERSYQFRNLKKLYLSKESKFRWYTRESMYHLLLTILFPVKGSRMDAFLKEHRKM